MENSQLQELQDRMAIEEVRHRYAQALDYQNWGALPSLFTDEVMIDFPDFGMSAQTVAREDFINSFQHNLSRPGLKTQHIFSSFRVHVEGDRATSISNFVGHHFLPGFEGGEEFTLRAEYTDTLTRAADGWRLSGVACKVFFMTGNPRLLANKA